MFGPVGGTYTIIFLVALSLLAALAWLLRPQLKRLGRYILNWIERDRRAEEEAHQQVKQRQQAEQEVKQYLHEEETQEQQPLQRQ